MNANCDAPVNTSSEMTIVWAAAQSAGAGERAERDGERADGEAERHASRTIGSRSTVARDRRLSIGATSPVR